MSHTFHEIMTQPESWRNALQEAERVLPDWRAVLGREDTLVIFTGCGSTYHLAQTAASLFRVLVGRRAVALPGGELVLYGEEWLWGIPRDGQPAVLVAISRSGSTTETIRAVEIHQASGGQVLAVTTRPDSPLAAMARAGLILPAGREESVVQTRSFSSMLVGLNAIAALLGGHSQLWRAMQRLPEAAERLIDRYLPLARSIGEDLSIQRFYFLGSGARYGLASEASLKMKELSLSPSEPFPFLEFRHGPMSTVDEATMIVGMISDRHRHHEMAVLKEMQSLGARILSIAEQDATVALDSGVPLAGRGALYLPVPQLMAAYRALARGLDPDRPRHLSAVVTLNLEDPNEERSKP